MENTIRVSVGLCDNQPMRKKLELLDEIIKHMNKEHGKNHTLHFEVSIS